MQHAVSQEGSDNKAFISSCSIIEMQRGIKIAGFLVGVCHCLRFTARCREGNGGIRGWDKRKGNRGWILKSKQSNSSGAETTFLGSRDDPGAVREEKKNVEGFYKVLFESQVKRQTVFYVLLQRGGWVARSGKG